MKTKTLKRKKNMPGSRIEQERRMIKLMNKYFILILFLYLSLFSNCDSGAGGWGLDFSDLEYTGDYYPLGVIERLSSLTDDIPFEHLGYGKIVFFRDSDTFEECGVYIIDLDNRTSWGYSGILFETPSVSPDGTNIAFCSLTKDYDCCIMNTDASDLINVSRVDGQDRHPSWGPENKQIYFRIALSPDSIYRQSPIEFPDDRIDVQKLNDLNINFNSPVSASVHGNLLFTTYGKIYKTDFDGNNKKILFDSDNEEGNRYSLYYAVWSPDGRRIACLLVQDGDDTSENKFYIMFMNKKGKEKVVVELKMDYPGEPSYENQHGSSSLCWSPDGTKLLFTIPDGTTMGHIWVINADGSGRRMVTSKFGVRDKSVSWSR